MQVQIRWFLLLNGLALWFSPFSARATLGLCASLTALLVMYRFHVIIRTYTLFAFNCFIKPLFHSEDSKIASSDPHQRRLETFYRGQSEIYDATRQRLLKGRSTMLRLCAAQVRQVYLQNSAEDATMIPSPPASPFLRPTPTRPKKLVWIDLGGGTGWNIEKMNEYIPISQFADVYLVDITPSLCAVAKQRFENLGWKNVHVICADALSWTPPCVDDLDSDREIGLITLSYALSMMPNPFAMVDLMDKWIHPNGILGVSDFYVSENHPSKEDPTRFHPFITRWFWQMWFETDNVHLNPLRRQYLEHRFLTVKSVNERNWVIKNLIGMPYYIWLGAKRSQEGVLSDKWLMAMKDRPTEQTDQEETSGANIPETMEKFEKEAEVSKEKLKKNLQRLTVQHIHGQGLQWRLSYDVQKLPEIPNTYIYAFAWEDPKVDLQFLDINSEDNMLVLTSGGCNALEYAIQGPRRIHAVDMNPCQGHLLELKLACMSALQYKDVWRLFGEGYHPDFKQLLDTHLSPYLSPEAFSFWKKNSDFNNFYETGCSGLAIRAFRFLVWLKGVQDVVDRLCQAPTKEEQEDIWYNELRPHFLDRKWIGLLNNYKFAWIALGVPKRQFEMLLNECSAYDYIANTFDPVVRNSLLAKDSYFYHLCLTKRYAGNDEEKCPGYLTPEGHKKLVSTKNLRAVRIHTDSIVNALRDRIATVENEIEDMENGKEAPLTKAVIMDHMDWFSTEQAHEEIEALHARLRPNGRVLFRSSSKKPWYLGIFIKYGFEIIPVGVRMSTRERDHERWAAWIKEESNLLQKRNELLGKKETPVFHEFADRVNMYASCFMAVKK